LRDFEKRAANPITITDADGIVRQSFDCEILAKLTMNKVSSLQLFLPIPIGFDLIHENGALLTTVPGQVPLTISLDIQPADSTAARHRIFPDRGMYRAPLPRNVAWKSDVYG
jgi:hypothetical protein